MAAERARAKVNLSLHVLGRRADGYHELASLIAFACVHDRLSFSPGGALDLSIVGPRAGQCGAFDDNLVLRAARELAARCPGLRLGSFSLDKRLPVAAGIGGGSADAAAALRLLARANHLAPDDARLYEAALACGADVPVCLVSRACLVRGVGEAIAPFALPRLATVLINPGVALSTAAVFSALGLRAGEKMRSAVDDPLPAGLAQDGEALIDWLKTRPNDLTQAAIGLQPVIGKVIDAIAGQSGCRLARMSGSGATCFGLFADPRAARAAARALQAAHPDWWVRATILGEKA